MTFVHRHRVRYHEVDAQGFWFNARFLEVADVAMAEYFRSLGWSYPNLLAAGCDPSVVKAQLEFTSPARLDEVVDYQVSCARVGTSSFDLDFHVVRAGAEVARLALTYVNVDTTAQPAASKPLPATISAGLRTGL